MTNVTKESKAALLHDFKKSELINITKDVTGSTGDYARLGKAHYIDLLSNADTATLAEAIFKETGFTADFENYPATASRTKQEGEDIPHVPTVQPKAAETEAPQMDADAANVLIGALGALIKPSMTPEAIKALVKTEIANSEMPTRTIVVNGAKEVELDEHTHPEFQDVLLYSGLRQSTMLVGPAGTGKTHLAHQIATALALPFASISCTAGMSESSLTGRLIPTGDAGKFEYCESDFVRLYEQGGVFLLDELDAADANVLMIINQALANGGFYISHRPDNSFVKRHPDFVCVAAANTYGNGADMMYAGRERLDAATLDRFESVHIDYDETLERKVVSESIRTWGMQVRRAINEKRLRRVMSTRRMIAMSQQLEAGMPLAKIKDRYFASWTVDERKKAQ